MFLLNFNSLDLSFKAYLIDFLVKFINNFDEVKVYARFTLTHNKANMRLNLLFIDQLNSNFY
jgi:hypothetical protein